MGKSYFYTRVGRDMSGPVPGQRPDDAKNPFGLKSPTETVLVLPGGIEGQPVDSINRQDFLRYDPVFPAPRFFLQVIVKSGSDF